MRGVSPGIASGHASAAHHGEGDAESHDCHSDESGEKGLVVLWSPSSKSPIGSEDGTFWYFLAWDEPVGVAAGGGDASTAGGCIAWVVLLSHFLGRLPSCVSTVVVSFPPTTSFSSPRSSSVAVSSTSVVSLLPAILLRFLFFDLRGHGTGNCSFIPNNWHHAVRQ